MIDTFKSQLNDVFAEATLIVSVLPFSDEQRSIARNSFFELLEQFNNELEACEDDKAYLKTLGKAKNAFWTKAKEHIFSYLSSVEIRLRNTTNETDKVAVKEALELLNAKILDPTKRVKNILEGGPNQNYSLNDCRDDLLDIITSEITLKGFENSVDKKTWGNPRAHIVSGVIGLGTGLLFYLLTLI